MRIEQASEREGATVPQASDNGLDRVSLPPSSRAETRAHPSLPLLALLVVAGGGIAASIGGSKTADHRTHDTALRNAKQADEVMPFHAILRSFNSGIESERLHQVSPQNLAKVIDELYRRVRLENGAVKPEGRELMLAYKQELGNMKALLAGANGLEARLLQKCCDAQTELGRVLQNVVDGGERGALAENLSFRLEDYLSVTISYFRMLEAGETSPLK